MDGGGEEDSNDKTVAKEPDGVVEEEDSSWLESVFASE